jgi:hypothetical protein
MKTVIWILILCFSSVSYSFEQEAFENMLGFCRIQVSSNKATTYFALKESKSCDLIGQESFVKLENISDGTAFRVISFIEKLTNNQTFRNSTFESFYNLIEQNGDFFKSIKTTLANGELKIINIKLKVIREKRQTADLIEVKLRNEQVQSKVTLTLFDGKKFLLIGASEEIID